MKLVHSMYEAVFEYNGTGCQEWIVENPVTFREIIKELRQQAQGEEGRFVLSDDDKILSIDKCIDLVTDVSYIDINNKKILSKLYGELKIISTSGEMYELTQEVYSTLKKYIYSLEDIVDSDLSTSDEMDYTGIFKSMDVKIDIMEEDYYSILIRYLKEMTHWIHTKLFVFVSLHSFLSDEEIKDFVYQCEKNQYSVLLIDNNTYDTINNIKRFIIDKDNCEIF